MSSPTNFNHFRSRSRRKTITAFWQALPAVSVIFLILLQIAPGHGSPLIQIMPPLPFMAIFFWAYDNPQRMRGGTVFFLGLLQDIIIGTPLGFTSVLWLAGHHLLLTGRQDIEDQGFIVTWLFAALLFLILLMVQWMAMAAYYGRYYPLTPVGLQYCEAVLLFPLMHFLLHRFRHGYYRKYWYFLKPS